MPKKKKPKAPKPRSVETLMMILRTGGHAGAHKNRAFEETRGHSRKVKHKNKDNYE